MNVTLIDSLTRLRTDPTLVVDLYGQLFVGHFWALARSATAIEAMEFLTYLSADGTRELPVFTQRARRLLANLTRDVAAAQIQEVEGPQFWTRALQLLEADAFCVAVDPGEDHGIRLTKEMILGMVNLYAAK